jgi:hypothetical protein
MRWQNALNDWSKEKLREGLLSMLETWEEAERRLRRKMRVYPGLAKARHPEAALPPHRKRQSGEQNTENRRFEDARRTAIVSLYSEDLSSEDQVAEAHAREAESAKNRRKRTAA